MESSDRMAIRHGKLLDHAMHGGTAVDDKNGGPHRKHLALPSEATLTKGLTTVKENAESHW